jgi:glycosyltransferase involved in cell wall biosynthesis
LKGFGKIKFISIVIPCRNEEAFIAEVLDNVIAQDYPKSHMEVFVVDGESDDKTAAIIKKYAQDYPFIQFLSNPEKVVPFALNKAIRKSKGDVIVRMDAHSIYPFDYVSRLVKGLEEFNCENTGGVWITEPANKSSKAAAIAKATSHPFGIGNAYYRLEVKEPKQVDTVPFGCYKRSVFDKIGSFDEDLVRNQDDEFNARLIKNGGKIFLLPDVKIRYFARETLRKTSKMFYQYGLYKPLVNLKVGQAATIRQFVPLAFLLFVLVFTPLSFVGSYFFLLFRIGMLFYFAVDAFVSISLAAKSKNGHKILGYLLVLFPIIHFSYGYGYLAGIFRFIIFRKKIDHSSVNVNR